MHTDVLSVTVGPNGQDGTPGPNRLWMGIIERLGSGLFFLSKFVFCPWSVLYFMNSIASVLRGIKPIPYYRHRDNTGVQKQYSSYKRLSNKRAGDKYL